MDAIEKILRKHVEYYDAEYQEIKRDIAENMEEQKDNLFYADYLTQPVKKQQILFWCKEEKTSDGTPRQIFDYLYQTYGDFYEYVWVTKTRKDKPQGLPSEVKFVKSRTNEYWQALAESKYLVGNWVLPASFVKRKEQVYINTMMGPECFWQEDGEKNVDDKSIILSEKTKIDYLFLKTDSVQIITEMFISKHQEERKETSEGKKAGEQSNRKKVLVMANWNNTQEQRATARYLVGMLCPEKYEVTIMARRANKSLNDAFEETLSTTIKKILYRGRMVLNETEKIYMQIIEKHWQIYLAEPAIQEYVAGIMQREWVRLCGEEQYDSIVTVGKLSLKQYFLIASAKNAEKILLDEETLPNVWKQNVQQWQQLISAFDRIYNILQCDTVLRYGELNRNRVEHLPVVRVKAQNEKEIVYLTMQGKQYFVADIWRRNQCDSNFHLVELPAKGSCIVDARYLVDISKKEWLKQQLKEQKMIYFAGENIAQYQSLVNGKYEVLDGSILNYLYMLPAAAVFFERISCYYTSGKGNWDTIQECCKLYGVKIL